MPSPRASTASDVTPRPLRNAPPQRRSRSRALWAIAAYFNPGGYRQRLLNYRNFRRHLQAPLVTVELSCGRDFELERGDADILVQLRDGDILWQKERLLNIALTALPASCSKVAWLDCDIVFASDDWVSRTRRRLDTVPLLQPFSRAHYLPKCVRSEPFSIEQAESTRPSIAYATASGVSVTSWLEKPSGERVPPAVGLAWAARRELLERHGLYDACIIGGGDRALILAAEGRFAELMNAQSMNEAQRLRYLAWAKGFHASAPSAANYVEGDIFHLWHGSWAERSYKNRHARLSRFGFDPSEDIAASDGGAWRWTSEKPALHAFMLSYFQTRREDG